MMGVTVAAPVSVALVEDPALYWTNSTDRAPLEEKPQFERDAEHPLPDGNVWGSLGPSGGPLCCTSFGHYNSGIRGSAARTTSLHGTARLERGDLRLAEPSLP
jgi:hypothetical protein